MADEQSADQNEQDDSMEPGTALVRSISHLRSIGIGLLLFCVIACIILAILKSNGLTRITVTALEGTVEPRDHNLPLIKQKEALPDYEIVVHLKNGEKVKLGMKSDTSAAGGLTWDVTDPVSTASIAGIRLQEQDQLLSDVVAEVQITSETVTEKGYEFEFKTERSLMVGIEAFFTTPIGKAVTGGIFIAIILLFLIGFA